MFQNDVLNTIEHIATQSTPLWNADIDYTWLSLASKLGFYNSKFVLAVEKFDVIKCSPAKIFFFLPLAKHIEEVLMGHSIICPFYINASNAKLLLIELCLVNKIP